MSDQRKTCSKCSQSFPASSFGKQASCSDGLRRECKACDRERRISYLVANRERILERRAFYRAANAAKLKVQAKKHRAKAGPLHAARSAKWRKQNPEKWKACYLASRVRNADAIEAYGLAYRLAHRHEQCVASKAYAKRFPEKVRLRQSAYSRYKIHALSDTYIKNVLRRHIPKGIDIPPQLVEAKRLQLKVHRLIKEKQK